MWRMSRPGSSDTPDILIGILLTTLHVVIVNHGRFGATTRWGDKVRVEAPANGESLGNANEVLPANCMANRRTSLTTAKHLSLIHI